jgi:hypothetical protein
MKKNLIILFLTTFTFGIMSAQHPDETAKRTIEREVKTSGNYLYGEATDNTKDKAIKAAKSALLSEINSVASNHSEWQFAKNIQASGVEYDTDMIDLMRGSKYRVIAYIKKDNIMAIFDKNTPKVKISDKPATQGKTLPTNVQPQKLTETNVTSASEKVQLKTDTAVLPVKPKVQVDGLLGEILNASSFNEALKILNANKRTGKAVHGNMNKLTIPEKAYLLVYKPTGEIVAILDKGSRDNRKDLLTGQVKGQEIQTQNQVIWFQLF